MNLGSQECRDVVPVEVRSWELFAHELPDPFKDGRVSDVRTIGSLVSSAGEQRNELALGGDDDGPRIASLGEGAGLVLMRENRQLDRLQISRREVLADKGHKSADRTHGSVGSEAVLNSTTNEVAFEALVVGAADLLGGEDVSESKEAVVWVFEGRRDIVAFI